MGQSNSGNVMGKQHHVIMNGLDRDLEINFKEQKIYNL